MRRDWLFLRSHVPPAVCDAGSQSPGRQTEGPGGEDPAAGDQAQQQDGGGHQEGPTEIHTSRSESLNAFYFKLFECHQLTNSLINIVTTVTPAASYLSLTEI